MYSGMTARRVGRVLSEGRRLGLKEIADRLGRTSGSLTSAITQMLNNDELCTDGAPPPPGTRWKRLSRGWRYWTTPEQRDALEQAVAGAHDPGLLHVGQSLAILSAPSVPDLTSVLTESFAVGAVAWAMRLSGDRPQLAIAVDRGEQLMLDQLASRLDAIGGSVVRLSPEELMTGADMRRYLRSVRSAADRA